MDWWESLLAWIDLDQASREGHREYWVVCRSVIVRREMQYVMTAAMMADERFADVQVTDGLVMIPKRASIFFYSDRELADAPSAALDGVLLENPVCVYKSHLLRRLAARNGWMRKIEEAKGACPRGEVEAADR